jgi:hypothetical protein
MSVKFQVQNGNTCECPCILKDGYCELTFRYTNINKIQDDGFSFYLIDKDGNERYIGTINGACKSYDYEYNCMCAEVDVFFFVATVYQDDLDPCLPCTINWTSKLVVDNGCGTFGVFEIIGPYGSVPDAGEIGGSGQIDLRSVCLPPEE